MSKHIPSVKYGPIYERSSGRMVGRVLFRDDGNGNTDPLFWITPSVRRVNSNEKHYVTGDPSEHITNPKEVEKLLRFVQTEIDNTLSEAISLVSGK